MAVRQKVIPGLYRDSVSLMQCASKVQEMPGVEQAGAMMATEANLDLARDAGMLGAGESVAASPNDVLLLIKGGDEAVANAAFEEAERILTETRVETGAEGAAERRPATSIRGAVDETPDARLALISTPGEYAASEALKALSLGLDVMVFSDNVSVEDEVMLKQLAHERGLLVMGPDCGTAIVGGVPLGFANVVRRGDIGVVGASGTGTQQVTVLIDRWGAGITHALGTGSHDLGDAVGGVTMTDAVRQLGADPATKVLLLVSKPPSQRIAAQVLDAAAESGKPIIACFLGAPVSEIERPGIRAATTLDEAAALAVVASTGRQPERPPAALLESAARAASGALAPGQRYIRGLYAGGTFSYEASLILSARLGRVASNTPASSEMRIADPWKSEAHTVIDLGDDEFTRGRPHPMIDQRLRLERLAHEAADPEVAVVLFDVVLGYGSHEDPASELAPAIAQAAEKAASAGRTVAFVGSICGTAGDPQGLASTEKRLADVGVLLADSNARAVGLAASIVDPMTGAEGATS